MASEEEAWALAEVGVPLGKASERLSRWPGWPGFASQRLSAHHCPRPSGTCPWEGSQDATHTRMAWLLFCTRWGLSAGLSDLIQSCQA